MKKKEEKKYPKWFYIILVFIPLIFLFILEIALVSFNYGNNYSTFVKISDELKDYKFFNPKLPEKYFSNTSTIPSVIPDGFKVKKDDNTYRIFALGGSTTAGFPHPPNGSFPRLLKRKLQSKYPQVYFEVINLGVSAINTITIRDIIDDVLKEDPDLLIFYAGHNEYYGALGPASNVSGFNNGFLTRTILWLKEFRTVQLVENFISEIFSIFAVQSKANKTLMSEIAGNNMVPLNSERFNLGVQQFRSNLEYIFLNCSEQNVPLLVGTLASNLMQQPLCKYSGCEALANEFNNLLSDDSLTKKDDLTRIKEYDELRFRAPEKFNEVIFEISEKFDLSVVDVKKIFELNSPNGIIGYNIMMDHLHPNYWGSSLLADGFIQQVIKQPNFNSFVNNFKSGKIKVDESYKHFTELDSFYSDYRIKFLLNDFPFVESKINVNFIPKSIEDSIALQAVHGKISWENAHLKLAKTYFQRKMYSKYMDEINTLIEDKPFDKYPYVEAMKDLKGSNRVDLEKFIYLKYYNVYPELFAAKKLGDIFFNENNHRASIYFYKKCLNETNDPTIFFNLSSSYFAMKNLAKAIENIQKCLKFNPNYPNAEKIYTGLMRIYKTKK